MLTTKQKQAKAAELVAVRRMAETECALTPGQDYRAVYERIVRRRLASGVQLDYGARSEQEEREVANMAARIYRGMMA